MVDYQAVMDFVSQQEDRMFSVLRDMVLIQSGSYNKEGVDRVVRLISGFFSDTPFHIKEIPQDKFGNHLLVCTEAARVSHKSILVTGHTDTVFPEDTTFNWYREDEERAYGPGVIDMKGGLVVGMFAMKALQHLGLSEEIPVRFLFNSDEEIGSPSSGQIIRELAKESEFGFVLECGSLDGRIVTGRKGKIGIRLLVEGGAGHAAFASEEKPSAILELAHKIIKIEALNDVTAGISVNVGTINGGTGPNVVAKNAEAGIDVRYTEPSQREIILSGLERIVGESIIPVVKSKYRIVSERPPMPQTERNRRLFEVIRDTGKKIGLDVNDEFRNGVSDANLIAAEGVPVVDGLGPIGDLDHSEREYMIKKSLPERTTLFTLSLIESWKRKGEL